MMPKIVFLNRHFYPDRSATSQLLSDLAFHLATKGRDVHVIAGSNEDGACTAKCETSIRGVSVHRVATGSGKSSKPIVPEADRVSFYFSAGHKLKRLLTLGDIVVAMTDPPLISVLAAQVTAQRQSSLINWQQDFYPEVAVASGVEIVGSHALSRLRDGALAAAVANVAIGERMADTLAAHGARRETIHVFHNWAAEHAIKPRPAVANRLRREWGLEGRCVVGYCGNLGRAHEIETVLAAAEHLRDRTDICFLFVGDGHLRTDLEAKVATRGLINFHFKPYQAPSIYESENGILEQVLSVPDIHWISLRPELEGLAVPSKFYAAAAAGRPIIAVTARDGEIAHLVERHKCGSNIPVGDGIGFARTIGVLAADRPRREEMGLHARRMLEENFSRRAALAKWHELLDTVAA